MDTFIMSQAPDMTHYIQRRERSGRFSVSCWGWMSDAGIDVVVRICRFNALQYVYILENLMLSSVRVWNPEGNLIYQQNNHPRALQHRHWKLVREEARDWTNALASQFTWFEHHRSKLKEGRILRYGNNRPWNPQQLWDQVVEIWYDLSQDRDYCLTFDSMPRRCQAVIDAGGMMTKY